MPMLEVVCPAGAAEGTTISVALAGGGSFEVAVPAGISEGMPFTVEYQDPTAFVEQLAMPEEQAAGLRSVLQALLDDESLDAFVDDHSEKFKAYTADGEQSLEWGACHMAYVKLVEGILEATLAANGVSIEALYSLLDAQRSSSRGQSFINRFLSLGDYAVFCSMMCTWANLDSVKAQSRYIDDEQAAIDNL